MSLQKRSLRVLVAAVVVAIVGRADADSFLRGDANGDGRNDVSDALASLGYLFLGSEDLECLAAADVDDDERIEISDPIRLLEHLFLGGPPPSPPWPTAGVDPTPGLGCGDSDDLDPPTLLILSPSAGSTQSGDGFRLRGRVDDAGGIARLVVDGIEVTVPDGVVLPWTFSVDVLRPDAAVGPRLVRVEAVDRAGNASFAELPIGYAPIVRDDRETTALDLVISGSTGYDELERIIAPFLSDLPTALDQGLRGVRLFDGTIAGVDIVVTGNRVEVDGPLGFDLLPTGDAGGRLILRASIPVVRFYGDGRSDFGFLGTDSWNATWTGRNVTITGAVAFVVADESGTLRATSDGFDVQISSSEFTVSGFLDPFGIFDALVNSIAGLFAQEIQASVEEAVESAADEQILPVLEDALGGLAFSFDLDGLRLETRAEDVIESAEGLAMPFLGAWSGAQASPDWPRYPGTAARGAPPPRDIAPAATHDTDVVISLAADSLDQLLGELASTGAIAATFALDDVASPIPLTVGTLASLLDPRLAALPGVDASTPLALRLAGRVPPRVRLGEGSAGRTILPLGSPWRWRRGTSEPPGTWLGRSFDESAWDIGPSGFGYSSSPSELASIGTLLDDMAAGAYTTLYARARFEVPDPGVLAGLVLDLEYDDGFVAYLNGVEVGRENIGSAGSRPAFDALADEAREPTRVEIDLRSAVRAGDNVLAIQGHNAASTSSDFVLSPRVVETRPLGAGVLGAAPARIAVEGVDVRLVADVDADGIGDGDGDGVVDEVDLVGFDLSFLLQATLLLSRGEGDLPRIEIEIATEDGDDPDSFPDALVDGARGIRFGVSYERFDVDDDDLIELGQLLVTIFGRSLGESLASFETPAIPIPELEFDLDGDGLPDTRLEIVSASFATPDTDGDGSADWLSILADLRSAER